MKINNNAGFTLIELIVVIIIVSSLLGLLVFNLVGTQRNTEISSQTDIIVSDLSSQQNKAMLGAGGSSGNDYGIHFESNQYTLFEGSTYNPADSGNFVVNLDSGYQLTSTFPFGDIVFDSITGTVSGFLNGNNTVTLQEINGGKSKTVTINKYGVVTGEN